MLHDDDINLKQTCSLNAFLAGDVGMAPSYGLHKARRARAYLVYGLVAMHCGTLLVVPSPESD